MKKLLLAFLTLILLLPAVAQDDEKFQFGIKLGMEMATQNFEGKEDEEDLTPLFGPTGGFIFEIPINSWLEIRPELLFGTQGLRWKVTEGDDKLIEAQGLGYLQIPLLAKFKYGNEKIGGFLNFGPQFGVGLFGAYRARWDIAGEKDSERESVDFDELGLKRFDAGLAFGLGLECNKTGVEVEARYYTGLVDITDWDALIGMDRPDGWKKTTNQGFYFTVGWKF